MDQLDEIKIEGLSSLNTLKLNILSVERISLKNLKSLKNLVFDCFSETSSSLQNDLIDLLQTIEIFHFDNDSFSIDFSIVDKSLFIWFENIPNYNDDFDFEFIHHLYNRINKLVITKSDHDTLIKLLGDQNFPNLQHLRISYCDFYRLERKMLNGSFPAIQKLTIWSNEYLETIDHDAFSNLKHLRVLEINENYFIESLDVRLFSELVNLESVSMRRIQLKVIDGNGFSNLKRLEKIVINPFTVINQKSIIN